MLLKNLRNNELEWTPAFGKQHRTLISKVSFTDRIIFGRLHYNKLVSTYPGFQRFYNDAVKTVIDFCEELEIAYHIKAKTLIENPRGI
ncbi:MAG: hypothetical protein BWY18_00133 [Candidatus Cloacimonetes bacterium ADurb.Bin211]|jgi:hypothetical protein|nr:MAG: hypothetical protein BWY18_00133 [Candidatus Cloacimonetes bacterium ADurb.Bin211]